MDMDAFGDNFDQVEVDPAAEFLAREQDQLAGLEDEIKPVTATIAQSANEGLMTAFNDVANSPYVINNNLYNDSPASVSVKEEHNGSFEMIDNLGQPDSIETTRVFGSDNPSPPPSKAITREEPEKIRKWREEQKTRLEQKDADEEKKREEWREIAKKELEEWYKHHEEQIAKTKATNRNAEKQFVAEVDAIEPGTEWERIAKLCDFNPKASKTSKDVSRMRSIILQLKQNPPVPKAAKA